MNKSKDVFRLTSVYVQRCYQMYIYISTHTLSYCRLMHIHTYLNFCPSEIKKKEKEEKKTKTLLIRYWFNRITRLIHYQYRKEQKWFLYVYIDIQRHYQRTVVSIGLYWYSFDNEKPKDLTLRFFFGDLALHLLRLVGGGVMNIHMQLI